MLRLDGKVAVVTGGSSGIGRAAALAFAREGARVLIAARGVERGEAVVKEIQAAGGIALFVPADVSRAADVEQLIGKTVEAFGRIDCAFNNAAAVDEPLTPTADFTEEQFDHSLSVNLKSVWLCMRQEIRQMLAQDPPGGSIVNASSINGLGGAPHAALYSAAKAGVLGLTKSAALEYTPQGIRVNAIAFGPFRTPMLETQIDRMTGGKPAAREAFEKRVTELVAAGRVGRTEEAAEAVVWLASSAASYVTGHTMIVDGGLSAPLR